jgi:hypothetical protein
LLHETQGQNKMFHGTDNSGMKSAVTTRVQKHRELLRAAGLKPVQIWIPDTRSAQYRKKCEQESLSLIGDPQEAEALAWIAEVSDTDGWA